MTWDQRLYFPSERRRAEDFFTLKNPTASARFEPANLDFFFTSFLRTFQENLPVPSWIPPMKMEPIGCPETSAKNCHYTLCNSPEEHNCHLLHSVSLKYHVTIRHSHVPLCVMAKMYSESILLQLPQVPELTTKVTFCYSTLRNHIWEVVITNQRNILLPKMRQYVSPKFWQLNYQTTWCHKLEEHWHDKPGKVCIVWQ